MANGNGLKLGSVYALIYRKRYNTGSPTYQVIADSDKDSASSLIWSDFFFGNFSNTNQGQSSNTSGLISGIASTSSNTSQSQSSLSTGVLDLFSRAYTITGKGFSLGLSYSFIYRKRYNTGSPFLQFISNNTDQTSRIVWTHFYFGINSNTNQGQSSNSSGLVSGFAGTSSTSQAQESSSVGNLNEFIRPDTSINVYKKIGSIYGIKYRQKFSCGSPVSSIWNNKEYNFIWNNWFFGIGSNTAQGGQASLSTGSVGGTSGQSASSQASQTSLSTGIVNGNVGNSNTGQGSQTSNCSGDVFKNNGSDGQIVCVGVRASNITTKAYDAASGDFLWQVDHGADVYCVITDSDGNVYTGGNRTSSLTTRKYNNIGHLQWSSDHEARVTGIAVDSDGNVYTCGSTFVRKYNSSGIEITTGWPFYHFQAIYAICVDSSNNIYITGDEYNDSGTFKTTRKLNSSGAEQWSFNHRVTTLAISITGSYVTIGGYQNFTDSPSRTSISLNQSTGAVISGSTKLHGDNVYGIARNSNADYVGNRASSITTNINGVSLDHGANVKCICVNANDGSVYTGGLSSGGVTVRKYTSSGTAITSDSWPISTGSDIYGIAWSGNFIDLSVSAPGVPIAISLGLPVTGVFCESPALSLAIALGLPTVTDPPNPPDILVRPGQPIYRLIVSGNPSIELPVQSFQCQRRLGESSFLKLTVPYYSISVFNALMASRAINSIIILYAGLRYDGGQEVMGQFLRATLIDVETSVQAKYATISINSRIINPSWTAQNRVLAGVREIGYDGARRTVKCAVDPLLRPNDSAFDGVQTWTVGAISYEVSTYDSVMTVTQA